MALINAIITVKEKEKEDTLLTEFPKNYLDIYEELLSVGCRKPLERIRLTDNDGDDIRVKLYADSDVGNHLLRLFSESDTLNTVNIVALTVQAAADDIKEEVEEKLLYDQYSDPRELLQNIKEMAKQAGPVKVSFFCPLEGNLDDGENSDYQPVGNWFLKSYEWDIRELLEMEQKSPEDAMAQYYDDDASIKNKLVSAVWTVDEYKGTLYGRIDCRFREPLTEAETEIFKDWITGQNSDGFGEGFEQRAIDTEDGDLYVSFWNRSDGYFVCTEDELDECIDHTTGIQFGGM